MIHQHSRWRSSRPRAGSWAVVLVLLSALPVGAQPLPARGTASTFEAATWNINWFGSPANGPSDEQQQLRNVARIIRESEIDLWAVQEIDDAAHFHRLLDELGPEWAGEISRTGSNFKLGFVYRRDVIFVRQKSAILTSQSSQFAGRPPLQIEADVMLPSDTLQIVFINVHMKAFGDDRSYDQRVAGASLLKEHVDGPLAHRAVVVLGDFNDELGTSISSARPSPYQDFLAASDEYRFLSWTLDAEDAHTFCATSSCGSGATFDHILVTNEIVEAYGAPHARTYAEVLGAVDGYTTTTSDHLPVYARFEKGSSTGYVRRPEKTSPRLTIYPNPFDAFTAIEYEMTLPGRAGLTLYDVMGRVVRRHVDPFRAAGIHRFRVDGRGLAAGVYVALVDAPGGRLSARVVRAH